MRPEACKTVVPANLGAANSSEEASMALLQADCNRQEQDQNVSIREKSPEPSTGVREATGEGCC